MIEENEDINISSPERIVNDLLNTEKQLAEETLRLIRQRTEREKEQWSRIFENKEKDVLNIKGQLRVAEEKIGALQKKLSQERETAIERIKSQSMDIELQKKQQQNKWSMVEDEIKKYRQEAEIARSQFMQLQNQLVDYKKNSKKSEDDLKELLSKKDEELLSLKEQILLADQKYLKEKASFQESINNLEQKSSRLESTLTDEKLYQEKIIQKKDEEIVKLKESVLEKIDSITHLEEKRLEEEQTRINAEGKVIEIEIEHKKLRQELEEERAQWRKRWEEERLSWEKIKEDYSNREGTLKSETEEQINRIMESLSSVERRLEDEKAARLSAEHKNIELQSEIENQVSRHDELAAQWHRAYSDESASFKKRHEDIISEYEKNRLLREREILNLSNEISSLKAANSESERIYTLEKNESSQKAEKIKLLEEQIKSLNFTVEDRERCWKKVLSDEIARGDAKNKIEIEKNELILFSREKELAELSLRHESLLADYNRSKSEYGVMLNSIMQKDSTIKELNSLIASKKSEMEEIYDNWRSSADAARGEYELQKRQLTEEIERLNNESTTVSENFKKEMEKTKNELVEKDVELGELKRRLYSVELERNSTLNRHNVELEDKEKEIARLLSDLAKMHENNHKLFKEKEDIFSDNAALKNSILAMEQEKNRILAELEERKKESEGQLIGLREKERERLIAISEMSKKYEIEKMALIAGFELQKGEHAKKIVQFAHEKENFEKEKEKVIHQFKSEIENYKRLGLKDSGEKKQLENALSQSKARIQELEIYNEEMSVRSKNELGRMNERLSSTISELQNEKNDLIDSASALESELKTKENALSEQNSKISQLKKNLAELSETVKVKDEIINDLSQKNNELIAENSSNKELFKIEQSRLSDELLAIKNKIAIVENEKLSWDREVKELKEKAAGLDALEKKRELMLKDWNAEREEWKKATQDERTAFERRLTESQLCFDEALNSKNISIDRLSKQRDKLKIELAKRKKK